MQRITNDKIDKDRIVSQVTQTSAGAIVTFAGIVRDNFNGKKVLRMKYEANIDMASDMISSLEEEIKDQFNITDIIIQHRIGMLELSEDSVFIAVSSPHRAEGFDACRYAIDNLKKSVPIWKKEFFEDGESWVEGTPVTAG